MDYLMDLLLKGWESEVGSQKKDFAWISLCYNPEILPKQSIFLS
jgi:hypothetical protein